MKKGFFTFNLFHFFTGKLFEANLQPPLVAFTDRFGCQVFLALKGEMNNSALGRIKFAESKRAAIFAHVIGSEMHHSPKLSFTSLPKTIGINDETVFAVELAAHDLEQQHFESIEHLAILGKSKVSIVAAQIKEAALISPLG